MSIHVPDSSKCCLFVFLLGAILQGVPGFSQELPDAPSVVRNANSSAAERSDAASDPPKSPDTGSLDSNDGKFPRRWAKRGLRDQAGIYTVPFHRSELKWVIGLPAVTLGLIAIDKHASGATIEERHKCEHRYFRCGPVRHGGSGGGVTPRWRNTRRFSCPRNWSAGSRGYGQQRRGVCGAPVDH